MSYALSVTYMLNFFSMLFGTMKSQEIYGAKVAQLNISFVDLLSLPIGYLYQIELVKWLY